ncbi:hypothetical protein ACJA3J_05710 [Halobacillus sp. SY10]|uniref:hypothetical protein n=1 Tax=Halobacillus sp. SY10 TaxID=3381356 RepID=UPI0038794EDD
MQFRALFFNGIRIDIAGQYSQRLDGSLVLQLDKMMPSTELRRLISEGISYLWLGKPGGEQWEVHKGPFCLYERFGLLILSPNK